MGGAILARKAEFTAVRTILSGKIAGIAAEDIRARPAHEFISKGGGSMNKIGVIGGRDSVLGFRALGLDTCIAENGEQAKAALHRMAKENYAIIYITEHLAAQIPAEIERRREDVSPAVILIPGREGSLGIGTAGVHAAAEKAVGADIL